MEGKLTYKLGAFDLGKLSRHDDLFYYYFCTLTVSTDQGFLRGGVPKVAIGFMNSEIRTINTLNSEEQEKATNVPKKKQDTMLHVNNFGIYLVQNGILKVSKCPQ